MVLAPALLVLLTAPLNADKTVELPKAGAFDAIEFDADYRRVLAAHSGAGTLAILDTVTGKVQEIETGSVNGIGISRKLDRYFVTGGNEELVALDRKSLKIVGRVKLSGPADLIAVDTKRDQVIVAHDDGTEDWVFTAADLSPVGTIAIEEAPEFMEYDRQSDRIYQNIKSTDHLQVIDPAIRKVVSTWETAPMKSPHGLVLDRSVRRVYSAGRNGKLVILSMTTGKVSRTVEIPTGTDGIAIDPKLGRVYCPGKGKMSVVSTKDGAVLGEVTLPAGAKNVAVDSKNHTVWVNVGDDRSARLISFKP